MVILEFIVVSLVGGSVLAAGLVYWDRWRDRVQARAIAQVDKKE
jgi:hypothetical protein